MQKFYMSFWCLLFYLVGANGVPNFLIFIADDLGYNDIGVDGSVTIKTPNIDKLAHEGTRFTQFYSGAPLCTPSRGALLTGKQPIEIGLFTKVKPPKDDFFRVFYPSSLGCLSQDALTLAEVLSQSSSKYSTALVGKWHLGHRFSCLPTSRGFDFFFGLPYSHEEGWPTEPEGWLWPPVPLMENNNIVEQPVNLSQLTQRYNRYVDDLMFSWSETRQPFFLMVAYEQPHIPLFASPEFQNTSLRGPYGDAVQEMDASIGEIMKSLYNYNLHKDTLVIFLSDNGAWINVSSGLPWSKTLDPFAGGSNAPFKDGKGSTWEGGQRIPAIFWWPNVVLSEHVEFSFASMLDIFYTVLEWAQINASSFRSSGSGTSIVPLLTGTNTTSPHSFFHFWRERYLYAIRYGPWKCHWLTRPGFGNEMPQVHNPCLLFNIEWDPSESYPLDILEYPDLFNVFYQEFYNQINSTVVATPQYGLQSWFAVPCCSGKINLVDVLETIITEASIGISVWSSLGCCCNSTVCK